MRQKLFLSAALIGLAIGPAMAQTSGTTTSPSGTPGTSSPTMSQQSPSTTGGSQSLAAAPANALMGSRLSDMSVRNQSDESVGEIDDFVLDQDGKIQQVIIQTGGVLGMGGKKVALAWDQVKIDASKRVAVVNMSQDQLKNMPEFKAPERENGSRDRAAPARSGAGGAGGAGTMGTGGAGGSGTTRP